MECITTHKKNRENRGVLGKNDIFPTMSLYFHPLPAKIWTLLPYEMYVFGMSKSWATHKNLRVCCELKIL